MVACRLCSYRVVKTCTFTLKHLLQPCTVKEKQQKMNSNRFRDTNTHTYRNKQIETQSVDRRLCRDPNTTPKRLNSHTPQKRQQQQQQGFQKDSLVRRWCELFCERPLQHSGYVLSLCIQRAALRRGPKPSLDGSKRLASLLTGAVSTICQASSPGVNGKRCGFSIKRQGGCISILYAGDRENKNAFPLQKERLDEWRQAAFVFGTVNVTEMCLSD